MVYAVNVMPGVEGLDADRAKAKERRDKDVTAQLYEQYPVRHWDHYVGPRQTHLFVAGPPPGGERAERPRDLTPQPGWALEDVAATVTPDGRTAVTTWRGDVDDPRQLRVALAAVDVASDERTMIADERAAGPGGHAGATLTSSAADPIPTASPSEKSLPGPTTSKPTTPRE